MLNKRTIGMLLALAILAILPFQALAASDPDTTTKSANDITDTSARLRGQVDGNGSSGRAWFEYGENRNLDETTDDERVGSGTSTFTINITDLYPDTTYYFRAVAENDVGTDYGNILSFRTDDSFQNNSYTQNRYNNNSRAPVATTEGASNVGNSSAQLNSLITNSYNNSANAWFEWGTTPYLGYSTIVVAVGAAPEVTHSDLLSGLSPNTTYYFRAVAENSYWRNIGSTFSFTTGPGITITRTIIVREPAETPQTPTPQTPDSNSTNTNNSNQSANALATNYFLPQSLLGWMVLLVLILIVVFLAKRAYTPVHSHETLHADHH